MTALVRGGGRLLSSLPSCALSHSRGIARIPHYENHIRFDPQVGRKRPSQDVLDRFKRLNNGMWIHTHPGRTHLRYIKQDNQHWATVSEYHETCTAEQCWMLDRMMTPFWLRPKYYVDDPYSPYHTRHGITSPRVDYKGRMKRERPKILVEDCVAERHFHDR